MILCTDEEAGIIPFHQWKSELYGQLQSEGRAYEKEWYYRKYGEYCQRQRREFVKKQAQQAAKAP